MLVSAHVGARGWRDLQELDVVAVRRVAVEEFLVGAEALHQTLGVVQPVDANDGLAACVGGAAHGMRAALVAFGELLDFVRHHTDGVDAGAEVLPIGGQAAIRLDDATHLAGDVVLKGQAVGVSLEADQVVVAERLEQVVMRRDGGEDFRRRKRDVQEEADAVAHAKLAAGFGEGDQVVVVDPDDVVGPEQRHELLGQHGVDPPVAVVFLAAVAGQVDAVVKDRPQRGVGEAAVILVVVTLVQRQRDIGDVADFLGVDGRGRADLAAPAEPDASGLAQGIVDTDGQPSGSHLARLDRRDSVGNHY